MDATRVNSVRRSTVPAATRTAAIIESGLAIPRPAMPKAVPCAVIEHLETASCIEEVRSCLFDEAGREAFEAVVRERFTEKWLERCLDHEQSPGREADYDV